LLAHNCARKLETLKKKQSNLERNMLKIEIISKEKKAKTWVTPKLIMDLNPGFLNLFLHLYFILFLIVLLHLLI